MPFGLYIHIPFCRSKCPYCGFCSFTDRESLIRMTDYAEAVSQELRMRLDSGLFSTGKPDTLYIGGGTPSIVPIAVIRTMIEPLMTVHAQEPSALSIESNLIPCDPCNPCNSWPVHAQEPVEFSIESNPESLTEHWLEGMLECGANRISIGIQSLDNTILETLGRIHTADQARRAVSMARKAGFGNVAVDLMFGIPGQTMTSWEETLRGVLDCAPDHISCYSLSVEEDTAYFALMQKQELHIPDPGMTADMYARMAELLEAHGFHRYEISNFARRGFECRHNMAYWDHTPYLGLGVSAHSFDGAVRSWNGMVPEEYIASCRAGRLPVSGSETLDSETQLMERIMLSLRTSAGLSLGLPGETEPSVTRTLNELVERYIEAGYLERNGDRVRLTSKGAVVSDSLIAEIAAEIN